MSDEESFVILEPQSNSITSNESSIISIKPQDVNEREPSMITTPDASIKSTIKPVSGLMEKYDSIQPWVSAHQGSVANEFLLGKIKADDIKQLLVTDGIQTDSPNTGRSMVQSYHEWSMLESRYVDEIHILKDSMQKTNLALRQKFTKSQEFLSAVRSLKEKHTAEIGEIGKVANDLRLETEQLKMEAAATTDVVKSLKETVEQLRAEKEQLNEMLEAKSIASQLVDDQNKNLLQICSERESIIKNQTARLIKLEQELEGFVMIDHKSITEPVIQPKPKEEEIKQLECQVNVAVGEKIVTDERCKEYMDQLDCLQVNLVSAQELLKKSTATIAEYESQQVLVATENETLKNQLIVYETQIEEYRGYVEKQIKDSVKQKCLHDELISENETLKKKLSVYERQVVEADKQKRLDDEKINRFEYDLATGSQQLTERTAELSTMSNECLFLRDQLDVYRKDFEAERECRSQIASEKEALLTQLTVLQRQNHQLANGAIGSPPQLFLCPLCRIGFETSVLLQQHVTRCID